MDNSKQLPINFFFCMVDRSDFNFLPFFIIILYRTSLSSSSSSSSPVVNIVYANVRPNPAAKVLGDILADASLRFSVPSTNLSIKTIDTNQQLTDLELPIENCPTRFLLQVQQRNGEVTTYETDLEINEQALPIPQVNFETELPVSFGSPTVTSGETTKPSAVMEEPEEDE